MEAAGDDICCLHLTIYWHICNSPCSTVLSRLLFSLALILILQTVLVTILGIFTIALVYIDIYFADKYEIKKFGEEYED